MASSKFDEQIDSLQESIQTVSRDVLSNEAARKKLLGVTMQAMNMLETPLETIWRIIMSVRLAPIPLIQPNWALLILYRS